MWHSQCSTTDPLRYYNCRQEKWAFPPLISQPLSLWAHPAVAESILYSEILRSWVRSMLPNEQLWNCIIYHGKKKCLWVVHSNSPHRAAWMPVQRWGKAQNLHGLIILQLKNKQKIHFLEIILNHVFTGIGCKLLWSKMNNILGKKEMLVKWTHKWEYSISYMGCSCENKFPQPA